MIRDKVGGSRARHFVRITLAALVFYFGAALLLAAANLPVPFPPPEPWMAALPSRPLATRLLGALLVIVAMALWRRLEAGFYVSFTLLSLGAAVELWRGFGVVAAGPLLVLAAALALSRHAFDRKSAGFHRARGYRPFDQRWSAQASASPQARADASSNHQIEYSPARPARSPTARRSGRRGLLPRRPR